MQAVSRSLSRLQPSWIVTTLIIVMIVIAAIVNHNVMRSQFDSYHRQYGQALTNLVARRAIDAMVNNDLVSLQAILGEVAENKLVANATIYDVENRLLVQSGRRSSPTTKTMSFTAPITAHNNVSGYLSVTLALTNAQTLAQQTTLVFVALALCLIGLGLLTTRGVFDRLGRDHRVVNLQRTQPAASADRESSALEKDSTEVAQRESLPIIQPSLSQKLMAQEQELLDTDHSLAAPSADKKLPQYSIELVVQFKNLRRLYSQLNNKSFQSLCHRIETQLKGVVALYSGKLLQVNVDQIHILFTANDPTQAVLQGSCSAYLLSQLNQQASNIQLETSYGIALREKDSAILKNLPYNLFQRDEWMHLLTESNDGAILMESQLLELAQGIEERLDYQIFAEDDQLIEIQQINEPYRSLLDKQLAQLKTY